MVTDMDAIIEVLMETVLSTRSVKGVTRKAIGATK
jgi:hypothetical protein